MKMRNGCRKAGFTLIELLVVIAIIAILASILLPIFAKAKKESHKSVCQSNLHQIYTGLSMYAKDNDEKAPLLIEPWDWNTYKSNPKYSGRFLHTALGDYVKTDQIFFCPAWEAIERDGTRSGSKWYDKYTWGPIGYSHAPNWPDSGYTNGTFADPTLLDAGRNTYVRSTSQAKYPDRLIILLCNTPNDHSGYIDSEVSNQYKNLILGSNFMYADGHVKFIRFYAKDWSDGNRRGTAFHTLWWMGGLPSGEAY